MSKIMSILSTLLMVAALLFLAYAGFAWYSRSVLGFGACYRCNIPWNMAEHHETWYATGVACFPLCEKCWIALTPQTRLPYYKQLVLDGWRDKWNDKDADKKWVLIKAAAEAGK